MEQSSKKLINLHFTDYFRKGKHEMFSLGEIPRLMKFLKLRRN